MEKKYDYFIELAPGYESVVDISAEDTDKDFWSRYIVNDDMVEAVRLLSKSLKPDDLKNDVWHYWIKGSYGTGKTYSAIVIKHLLQDDYNVVEKFLNKNKLFADVKDKFLGARKKGRYYVKFHSGECKQLNTSNKFLFQLEQFVRELLKENNFTYTGRNSLVDAVREKTKAFRGTLAEDFENDQFLQYWSSYDTFDDFFDLVIQGDIDACSQAQEILQAKDIGLATNLATFKAWIRDIFEGNAGLNKTGIFIIWDEFTEYIRSNDIDIIQQLSIFSKEMPFFIIYVMHEYPGLFAENVSASMDKADARFHKIDISLSEKTTLKLIGESIIPKDGMAPKWVDICDYLYASISDSVHYFMADPSVDMDAADLKKIFPIHPMTVSLVSKVAGLAASNRSIFKFLKSNDDDSFKAYVHNNGQYDWKWVTPDYLWDYYFVKDAGGVKEHTQNAEDCLKHYNKVAGQINDERTLRVFKAAMLLLATIGSGRTMKKSKGNKGIQATEKTLVYCFCGQIEKDAVADYLTNLDEQLHILTLAKDIDGDRRIELPYTSGGDELSSEIDTLKKDISIAKLFDNDGPFGEPLKKIFVPEEKAVIKRLVIETCWGTTQQVKYKFVKLKDIISKTNHKFGLLLVAVPSLEGLDKLKTTIQEELDADETNRVLVCILRYALPQNQIDTWYEFCAQGNLAQKQNNSVNANAYKNDAINLVGEWAGTAIGKDMDLMYGHIPAHVYTNKAVLSQFEKIVFNMFQAAPETIIKKVTLYKSVAWAPAYYGASLTTLTNKSAANENQKNFNQQWQDIVDILQDSDANIWECKTVDEVINMDTTKVARSVAALCAHLNRELTAGTVYLTDLWEGIQKELGYYDTGVCCYLLGFAFHFFIGKYIWHDGSNPHRLDEESIPTMIVAMCTNKAAGMKLSSESDVEKRFKEISKRIFGLSSDEIGDVYECRKNIKIHTTKSGYPVWALKYLNDTDYAGIKAEIIDIVDKYIEYILEIGNQPDVMEDVVGLIKQNPKIYTSLLSDLLKQKEKLANGMRNFIYLKSPEAKDACEEYGFTVGNLFTMLCRSLEEEIWQWRENEVADATSKLTLDLTLVGVVNNALNGKAESVEKIRETLSNYLGYMRVPGCIYVGIKSEWSQAVGAMYDISINKWTSYSKDEKLSVITLLKEHMPEAIENIEHPLSVLKDYIIKKGLGHFSDEEYEGILQSLPNEAYSQTENNFKTNIRQIIDELSYTKKVKLMTYNWQNGTGTESLSAWTDTHQIPATWVKPELSSVFSVLSGLGKKERVDITRLENAITDIQDADLIALSDQEIINKCFIINISSEKYVSLLLPHINELKKRIQDSGYKSPSSWTQSIVAIRKITDDFISKDLKPEVGDKAKIKIANMNTVDDLKRALSKIFDKSAEACLLFLDDED